MKERELHTDAEIVNLVLEGHIEMFELLIRRYNAMLYKTGRSYGFGHEDTQDLMQDTFVNAYFAISGFKGNAAFKTWLMRIMLNNCYRKKQKWLEKNMVTNEEWKDADRPLFSEPGLKNGADMMINREMAAILENALIQIPLDYRMVFSLREVNGMNVQQTAELLGITENNVKVRLNRAKSLLRKEIERSYDVQDIFEFHLKYCDQMVSRVYEQIQALRAE